MSDLFDKKILVAMPDGATYSVPVEVVAKHHAKHYAYNFGGNEVKSLLEGTVPLFADEREILEWAVDNMNWSDVDFHAVLVKREANEDDYQDAWVNGNHIIRSD